MAARLWPDRTVFEGYYVYALIDPRTQEIRYVGKCHGAPHRRHSGHVKEAKRTDKTSHRLNWIRQLLREGLEPDYIVLADLPTGDAAIIAERCWIARLRLEGMKLTNSTDGGEGCSNPSPETREKLRRRVLPPHTPERRAAQSERMRQRWQDPEYRARVKIARLIGPKIPGRGVGEELAAWRVENAKRMGAMQRGKVRSPELRARISESVKRAYTEGRLVSPRKGKKATEETRAKMRAAQARRYQGGDAQ